MLRGKYEDSPPAIYPYRAAMQCTVYLSTGSPEGLTTEEVNRTCPPRWSATIIDKTNHQFRRTGG